MSQLSALFQYESILKLLFVCSTKWYDDNLMHKVPSYPSTQTSKIQNNPYYTLDIYFSVSAACQHKISVTLDFMRHVLDIEPDLCVDYDSFLDETPGLSQMQSYIETDDELDSHGMFNENGI